MLGQSIRIILESGPGRRGEQSGRWRYLGLGRRNEIESVVVLFNCSTEVEAHLDIGEGAQVQRQFVVRVSW